jgi:hypothetical protein
MALPDNNKPFHPQASRLDNFQTAEKAAEAKALLNNPVLQDALVAIYSKATGTLVQSDVGSLTASAAHAMMKAISELQAQLQEYVSDDKIREKFHKETKR